MTHRTGCLAVMLLVAVSCGDAAPTATPTPTASPRAEASPTPTPDPFEEAEPLETVRPPTTAPSTPLPASCADLRGDGSAYALVVMVGRSFDPPCFRMSPGQGLRFQNDDEVTHNFTIEGAMDVDVGAEDEATTGPVGEVLREQVYEFSCRYHGAQGMRGRLQVAV